MVVVGPGSLLTSVLPNLLVDGIRQAMAISQAVKIYVCNVATQHGETDDFAVSDHFNALVKHVGPGLFDYVIANDNVGPELPEAWQSKPVKVDNVQVDGARVISADVVSEANRYHHDSEKLSATVMRLYTARNQVESANGTNNGSSNGAANGTSNGSGAASAEDSANAKRALG
jgi:uncharacterized cofD-like protein